jgi:Outer membrane protein beta-barrel domain
MLESGGNIDIVFRNGLKNLEVLPPDGVWDNIHPDIKRKPKILIYLSAAATVAVLLTLSFLTYQFSREITTANNNIVMASNEESVAPVIIPDLVKIHQNNVKENNVVIIPEEMIVENQAGDSKVPLTIINNPAQDVNILPAKNIGMYRGIESLDLQESVRMTSSLNKEFETGRLGQQFYQDNTQQDNSERWSVAAMASPTYYSKFNPGKDELASQLMSTEKPVISYSGGVAFTYKLSKRLSIQTGLYYSSFGQEVDGVNSYAGFMPFDNTKGDHNFEVLTTNGHVITTNPDVFLSSSGLVDRIETNISKDVFDPQKADLQYVDNNIQQDLSYLELPIKLRYKVVDKLVDINLIGGVSYNLLVGNSVYSVSDEGKYPIGKTEGLNPIIVSSSIGMGLGYNFSENFSLNLEPTFRYYLSPFNDMVSSGMHPYSFGVFSGISYKF